MRNTRINVREKKNDADFFNFPELKLNGRNVKNRPYIVIAQWKNGLKTEISYSQAEFEHLIRFANIIQHHFQMHSHLSGIMNEYYRAYVYFCFLKKKQVLEYADYFTPPTYQLYAFDFTKLFFEIPIKCRKQLVIDIEGFPTIHPECLNNV